VLESPAALLLSAMVQGHCFRRIIVTFVFVGNAGKMTDALCWGGGYCEDLAVEHAHFATAAYCGYPRTPAASVEEWQCGPDCEQSRKVYQVRQVTGTNVRLDASALIGRVGLRRKCMVAFRGTADLSGWIKDIESGIRVNVNNYGIECHVQSKNPKTNASHSKACLVGVGWADVYGTLRQRVNASLHEIGCTPGVELTITGHSLGAAVAQLAMFDMSSAGYHIVQSSVFGSPRVGDTTWVEAFEKRLGRDTVYRITYHQDPVPHLPMEGLGFMHASTEIYYSGNVSDGHTTCRSPTEAANCSMHYTGILGLIEKCVKNVQMCDHLNYMRMKKLTKMDGATCRNGTQEQNKRAIWL